MLQDICEEPLGELLLRNNLVQVIGADGEETQRGTPYWHWAQLLGRVFDLDMATCPFCHRGSLRIIAAITQESVMTRIVRHLKLASVPPPIAPARCRQEIVASDSSTTRGVVS